MLNAYFFSKSIKNWLPLQRYIILNASKLNSTFSSDSSSGSGSDSDSDLDSKISNKNATDKTEKGKSLDYLETAEKKQGQKWIEERSTKAAEILPTIETLEKDLFDGKNVIGEAVSEKSFIIKMLKEDQGNVKSVQNYEKEKGNVRRELSHNNNVIEEYAPKEPSIIRMLKEEQEKVKDVDRKVFSDRNVMEKYAPKEPSIIRMLKEEQEKVKDVDRKVFSDRNVMEEYAPKEPSIIRMLKKEQEKVKDVDRKVFSDRNVMEEYTPKEPSIIRMLKKEQEKVKDVDRKVFSNRNVMEEYAPKEPSIIRMLKKEQEKVKDVDRKGFSGRNVMEEYAPKEPSIIRMLKKEQENVKDVDRKFFSDRNVIEEYAPKEPSIIRKLREKLNTDLFHDIHKIEKDAREELSINGTLTEEQNKLKYIKAKDLQGLSVIKMLKKQQNRINYNKLSYQAEVPNVYTFEENRSTLFRSTDEEDFYCSKVEDILQRFQKLSYQDTAKSDSTESSDTSKLKTWNLCEERELQLMTKQYPNNAFEEMIMWTEEEKLWKFPIDNEQGIEEERNVHFSNHVFLERHLEDWCPTKGPIRHFMELVCNGLSKNPYMTIEEKQNHIMWYKDYFNSKRDLLKKQGFM